MYPTRQDPSPYSKGERWGSAAAHASTLVIGVPTWLLWFLLGAIQPLYLSLVTCPVLAYLIARAFRRRRLVWGAFQGMQASVMHLIILIVVFVASRVHSMPHLYLGFSTVGLLLVLYALWGATDTLFGYDFRYIGISDLLERVSQANLERQERRRHLFGRTNDKDRSS